MGECPPTGSFISLSEAAEIVGVRASKLRRKVVALGIETTKSANRRMIPVEALELLRN
jgi:hypothetical protein